MNILQASRCIDDSLVLQGVDNASHILPFFTDESVQLLFAGEWGCLVIFSAFSFLKNSPVVLPQSADALVPSSIF